MRRLPTDMRSMSYNLATTVWILYPVVLTHYQSQSTTFLFLSGCKFQVPFFPIHPFPLLLPLPFPCLPRREVAQSNQFLGSGKRCKSSPAGSAKRSPGQKCTAVFQSKEANDTLKLQGHTRVLRLVLLAARLRRIHWAHLSGCSCSHFYPENGAYDTDMWRTDGQIYTHIHTKSLWQYFARHSVLR